MLTLQILKPGMHLKLSQDNQLTDVFYLRPWGVSQVQKDERLVWVGRFPWTQPRDREAFLATVEALSLPEAEE